MVFRSQQNIVLGIVAGHKVTRYGMLLGTEEGITPREYRHNFLTSQGLKAQSPKVLGNGGELASKDGFRQGNAGIHHVAGHPEWYSIGCNSWHADGSSVRHGTGHSARYGDGHIVCAEQSAGHNGWHVAGHCDGHSARHSDRYSAGVCAGMYDIEDIGWHIAGHCGGHSSRHGDGHSLKHGDRSSTRHGAGHSAGHGDGHIVWH
eukprot:6786706-Ditylum_brightwellii.AAC.1